MTKDEALKLALSTLNEVRSETFRLMRNGQTLYAEKKIWDTITAIKEALAQPEEEPCGGCDGSGWIPRDPDIGTDQECFVCEGTGKNIDTTPPQRKPLTDEEIEALWDSMLYEDVGITALRKIARAIEAAHGIKGEA